VKWSYWWTDGRRQARTHTQARAGWLGTVILLWLEDFGSQYHHLQLCCFYQLQGPYASSSLHPGGTSDGRRRGVTCWWTHTNTNRECGGVALPERHARARWSFKCVIQLARSFSQSEKFGATFCSRQAHGSLLCK